MPADYNSGATQALSASFGRYGGAAPRGADCSGAGCSDNSLPFLMTDLCVLRSPGKPRPVLHRRENRCRGCTGGKTSTGTESAQEKRSHSHRFSSDGDAGERKVWHMLCFGAKQLGHHRACPAGDEYLRLVRQSLRQPLDQFAHGTHGPPI